MVEAQTASYKKQKSAQANLSKGVSQLRLLLAACKRNQTQCLTKQVYASDIRSSEDGSQGWCNCFLMLSENNVPTLSCLLLHDSAFIFSLCLHSWQEEEDCLWIRKANISQKSLEHLWLFFTDSELPNYFRCKEFWEVGTWLPWKE